jgi:NADH dehydrogenase (ubiquinone) Fe-S protein 1
MLTCSVNKLSFIIKKEISILEACKFIGILLPRFCFHELLSVAGNCRMCFVEIEGLEKPIASCAHVVEYNLTFFTQSSFVKKARENIIESLLLNHPLDCPICDQAGECDLQDQAHIFGSDITKFNLDRRAIEDKFCNPLIKTIMTRCIHCTRCVRFGSEIAGVEILGTVNRGSTTEISNYNSKIFSSEISGNIIDLCPVSCFTINKTCLKN